MTLQNRVLATGEFVAQPVRGLFMGNRGILHDENRQLGRARWKHKAWVTCVLKHKNWHRTVMTPGAYTELFFLDEAVALAAGHRPCAMCRNKDYKAFRQAADLTTSAKEMDAKLHAERCWPRDYLQRHHSAQASNLPNGAIYFDGAPKLIWNDYALPVFAGGYGPPVPRPIGQLDVITPPTTLKALSQGYRPMLHPSAIS